MAKFGTPQLALAVVLLETLWAGTTAQSGCTSALISLSPCLSFIQGNSSTPSSSCCSQLSSVVSSQPQCLCTVLGGGASSLGITINQTQALALPDACNVKTPPVSRCNRAGAPTESPTPSGTTTPSPSTKQPSTPSSPTTPAGSGSKTVPTTGDSSATTSEMGSLRLSGQLLFVFFSASFALILPPF